MSIRKEFDCNNKCGKRLYWGPNPNDKSRVLPYEVEGNQVHKCPKYSAPRRGAPIDLSWVKEFDECDLEQVNGRLASGAGWVPVAILSGQMGRVVYSARAREEGTRSRI